MPVRAASKEACNESEAESIRSECATMEADGVIAAAASGADGGVQAAHDVVRPGLEWIAWMSQIEDEALSQGAAAAARKAARPMGLQYPRKLRAFARGPGLGFECPAAVQRSADDGEFIRVTGRGDSAQAAILQCHQQLLFLLYAPLGENIGFGISGAEPPDALTSRFVRERGLALMDAAALPPS